MRISVRPTREQADNMPGFKKPMPLIGSPCAALHVRGRGGGGVRPEALATIRADGSQTRLVEAGQDCCPVNRDDPAVCGASSC